MPTSFKQDGAPFQRAIIPPVAAPRDREDESEEGLGFLGTIHPATAREAERELRPTWGGRSGLPGVERRW